MFYLNRIAFKLHFSRNFIDSVKDGKNNLSLTGLLSYKLQKTLFVLKRITMLECIMILQIEFLPSNTHKFIIRRFRTLIFKGKLDLEEKIQLPR